MIALVDVAHPRELRRDVSCVISRSVIDEDHFVFGIIEFAQRIETGGERPAAVVRTNNYRDEQCARQRTKRQPGVVLSEFFPKRVERFLWPPLLCHDAKCPIRDFLAPGEPFIGPRKENRPRQTALHYAIDMPTEHL